MALLKRSLSEDIRSGLGDALSSSSLYTEALEVLQSTYGHPHLVSKAYIQTLIELPKVNSNDYKGLLKASQSINGAVSSLRDGGFHNELQSSSLLDIIVTKLPLDIQSRWGRKIVKKHPICLTLEDFASWLHTHFKGEMMAKHITMNTSFTNKNGQKTGRPQDSKTKPMPTINTISNGIGDQNQNKPQSSSQKTLVTWLLRFDRNTQCDPSSRNVTSYLQVPELRDALTFIIRVDQFFCFGEEIRQLKHKKPVFATSRLVNLSPYLDLHGVMRVGGRLQHSSLPEEAKHPVILSPDSNFSNIIIRTVHVLCSHSSVERTLHGLRQRFHVVGARTAIQRCIRQCFPCKLRQNRHLQS